MSLRKRKSWTKIWTSRTGVHQYTSSYMLRNFSLWIIIGFVFLFSFTSLATVVQSKMNMTSMTLKKWTAHISIETLIGTMSMEMPRLQMYNDMKNIQTPKASNILFEMVTSINPEDPRTLIRREIPGFAFFDGQLVIAGQGVNYTDFPMESMIPLEEIMKDREAIVPKGSEQQETQEQESQSPPSLTTEGRKVVLIYHTHNTESWLAHLPSVDDPDSAYHPEMNITKVGQHLGQELEKRGIGAYVDTTNVVQNLKEAGLDYSLSYEKSRDVVKEVMAKEQDIHFIFDLHRDGQRREQTTVEIDGKTYARTFFVIGGRNKDYEKNLALAENFHHRLEQSYPGLSKGVILKQGGGNGEYNQSLSENNILIEIGGVDNTLEESYRTSEALAEVIADMYWEDKKVDTQPQEQDF